jgi:hypothetical protein
MCLNLKTDSKLQCIIAWILRERPLKKSELRSFCSLNYNLLRRTQHSFVLIAPSMHATRFGPSSGHHHACQYKNHKKENSLK